MKLRTILNLLTLVLTLVVNSLANILPLNGMNTGQISDSLPSLFTPAVYVFSIWSIIYIGLIAFGIYQALPSQRNNPRIERVGWWFVIANLFNSAWIFAWHYLQFGLSVVLMLGLLVSLLVIYERIGGGQPAGGNLDCERALQHLPGMDYRGTVKAASLPC